MHGRYNRLKAKAASERGRRMANARWEKDRARRSAEEPARIDELADFYRQNLPRHHGDPVGSLQWTDFATGRVTRWTVLRGDRSDRVILRSPDHRRTRSHGWTWITGHLRKILSSRLI